MAYAGPEDLKARFSARELAELTTADGEAIDDARLIAVLAEASAEIDGWLAQVAAITLPLASPPAILTGFACDIGFYKLIRLRGHAVTDDQRKRYEDSINYLKSLIKSDGALPPADPGGGDPDVPPTDVVVIPAGARFVSAPRVFDRGSF